MILAAFFGAWELAARLKLIDAFIFSQPTRIINAAVSLALSGSLTKHIGATLWESVLGFVLSTVIGTLMAMLLWWNDFLKKTLNPYLVVLNSLPKTALAPIIIVWIGNNVKSVIFTAVMTSVIVTILTVLTGFMEVSKDKIKLVEAFGGTKRQVLSKVVLPASIPAIVNALEINIGLSFVGVMVGEFLVAKSGLGYLIIYGSQILKMDWVMLSIIILCALAAILHQLVVLFEKRIINQ
ncbi:MAG: ABC transporter permease [Clostridiales bacterium]|nr:ABC transporter permease [Clostridiales bacterium]